MHWPQDVACLPGRLTALGERSHMDGHQEVESGYELPGMGLGGQRLRDMRQSLAATQAEREFVGHLLPEFDA